MLAASAWLGGCTQTTVLSHDPVFTPAALAQGGLGIGGVTSSADHDPMDMSVQFGPSLHKELVKKRRDLKVVSWYEIRRRVGDARLRACLDEFKDYATTGPETLADLRSTLQGSPRYLLLARLDQDVVTLRVDPKYTFGEKMTVTGNYLISERATTMAFHVFDLQTARRVWSASISGKLETRRYEDEADEADGWEDVLIDVLIDVYLSDPDSDKFPPPPDSDRVLKEIFKTLARKLP